jgi:hypothetical protein
VAKKIKLGPALIAGAIMVVVLIAIIVGLRSRPAEVDGYGDCRNAGYPVEESYPEVCRTPDGRRFTNPAQIPPTL